MRPTILLVGVLVLAVMADLALSASLLQSPLQPGLARIDVKTYGATGDGKADDTAAIQAAIDRAPNGSTIYFPPGTYLVNNFQALHRAGLQFEGEATLSIIRRLDLPGNVRIATFQGSTDIVIRRLTFDANGIEAFGGVNFFDVKRVRIEHTRFYDSMPRRPWKVDHYAYVFGGGTTPSEDIQILSNLIEDLQLEVDHSRNVRIEGNTILRGTGMGAWTPREGSVAEGYVITRNTVVDPSWSAIAFLIDSPTDPNHRFRRIRIVDNRIIRETTMGPAITIGAGDTSVSQRGNVFEDITIIGNVVEHRPGAPPLGQSEPIFALQSAKPAGFDFKRVAIKNNQITGNGAPDGWAMDLRRIHDSVVEANIARAVSNGIAVIDDQKNSRIQANAVGASNIAYHFGYSAGGNRLERNGYFGNPIKPLEVTAASPSDVIEQPRRVSPPPVSSRPRRPSVPPWPR